MVNPFSNLEDEKLMELYQNGEHLAFEVIYLRYKKNVYSYLKKRLSDQDSVEDVFQNIFIKFHKSRMKYDSKHALIKWIYTISRSELLDKLKKRELDQIEFKEDLFSPGVARPSDDEIDLDNESKLNNQEKRALKLRYYSDHDFEEISRKLGKTSSNVRKIISRGIKKLRLKYQN